jgi:hypothetical protein
MSDPEILSLLRSIDGRLGGVESRLGGVESRLGGVEARLDAVETRLATLETVTARAPDLRLLGHQMPTLIERVTELEASNTRAIAALNDISGKRHAGRGRSASFRSEGTSKRQIQS